MPYPKDTMTIQVNNGTAATTVTINRSNTMALANKIAEELGNTLYDIQIVPYCPNPYILTIGSNNTFIADSNDLVGYSATSGIVVLPVYEGSVEFGSLLGAGAIEAGDVIYDHVVKPSSGVLNAKIESQCTKLRILDQFGTSIAEWNPLSIGAVTSVHLWMTLKPLQTTISMVPIYRAGTLYQFNETAPIEGKDRRGCISRSSFSLPRISDAWVQFSQNNINFNNIFNRQLDTQTRQYEIQNELADRVGSLDVLSAGLTGANGGVGNFSGLGNILGPVGNAISMGLGGAVAAGASTEGFNIDRAARYEQTELALSLAKDVHAMNVANIKARPDTLTKIGVFETLTDDYFVLEVYTSTDAEKQWFKDYLRYHGCTINHISTFRTEADKIINQPGGDQFVTSFVRGTLLRCNLEDSHTANELMTELIKGVYIAL